MAAARGAKRAADVASAEKVSKPKIDAGLASQYGCIKTALMTGAGTNPELAKVVDAVIPLSLGAAMNERHPFQTRIVDTIGDLLQGMETGLKTDISSVEKQVQDAEAVKEQRTASMNTTSEELASKQASLAEAKRTLAATTINFRDLRDAFRQAEVQQSEFAESHVAMSAKLAATQVAMKDWLSPLKEDASLAAEEAAAKRKQLLGFLGSKEVGLDESLMTALPAALEKAHEARGPFDILAVQELENVMAARISAIEGDLETFEPKKLEMAAGVSAAKVKVDAASEELRANAKAYRALEEEERTIIFALADSKKVLKDTATGLRRLATALDKASGKLSKFQDGPLKTFNTLREKTSEEQKCDPVAEAPPATAEETTNDAGLTADAPQEAPKAAEAPVETMQD